MTAQPDVFACSEAEARALTDAITEAASRTFKLVIEAYERRAWAALGYSSWDAYCRAEFQNLALPKDERTGIIEALRSAGMSTRAIGAATGVSNATVSRSPVTSVTPGPVTGTDGKQYPPTQRKAQRADAVTDDGPGHPGDLADYMARTPTTEDEFNAAVVSAGRDGDPGWRNVVRHLELMRGETPEAKVEIGLYDYLVMNPSAEDDPKRAQKYAVQCQKAIGHMAALADTLRQMPWGYLTPDGVADARRERDRLMRALRTVRKQLDWVMFEQGGES